jgi:hypothetical protein
MVWSLLLSLVEFPQAFWPMKAKQDFSMFSSAAMLCSEVERDMNVHNLV